MFLTGSLGAHSGTVREDTATAMGEIPPLWVGVIRISRVPSDAPRQWLLFRVRTAQRIQGALRGLTRLSLHTLRFPASRLLRGLGDRDDSEQQSTRDGFMKKKIGVKEWIAMFREIGLNSAQMEQWHQGVRSPTPWWHQSFLEWLGLTSGRIHRRAESRASSDRVSGARRTTRT